MSEHADFETRWLRSNLSKWEEDIPVTNVGEENAGKFTTTKSFLKATRMTFNNPNATQISQTQGGRVSPVSVRIVAESTNQLRSVKQRANSYSSVGQQKHCGFQGEEGSCKAAPATTWKALGIVGLPDLQVEGSIKMSNFHPISVPKFNFSRETIDDSNQTFGIVKNSPASKSSELQPSLFQTGCDPTISKEGFQNGSSGDVSDLLSGFQTASGTKVKISKEAVNKVHNLFAGCELLTSEQIPYCQPTVTDVTLPSETTSGESKNVADAMFGPHKGVDVQAQASGFEMASGAKIKLSNMALERAKNLFDDCDQTFGSIGKASLASNTSKLQPSLFQTGCDFLGKEGFPNGSSGDVSDLLGSFRTASGTEVKISKEAVNKVNNLFAGCESLTSKQVSYCQPTAGDATELNRIKGTTLVETSKKVADMFVGRRTGANVQAQASGFEMASGAKIKMSSMALERAKNLFGEELDGFITGDSRKMFPLSDGNDTKQPPPLCSSSFSTAARSRSGTEKPPDPTQAPDKEEEFVCDTQLLRRVELETLQSRNFLNDKTSMEPASAAAVASNESGARKRGSSETEDLLDAKILKEDDAGGTQLSVRLDVLSAREAMRNMQKMMIEKKRQKKMRPVPGSRFKLKTDASVSERVKLRGLSFTSPTRDVRDSVLEVDAANASEFRFGGQRFFSSDALRNSTEECAQLLPVGCDGENVVLADDDTLGLKEIAQGFLSAPGIQTNLISDVWIANHYRWIIWKLASLERRFADSFVDVALTPKEVMAQLRLRYDVEIGNGRRSALKLICEGDGSAGNGLVLCVARIRSLAEKAVLELSDGWYSLPCVVGAENVMLSLVKSAKIKEGFKIMSFGAEVVNLTQPCSPLDLPTFESLVANLPNISDDVVHLKLHANSSRIVKWDTKLGFYPKAKSIPTKFSSLLNGGGIISELRVEVVRQYPLVYKQVSSEDCSTKFVNEKFYHRMCQNQTMDKEALVETLYAQVTKEFEERDNCRLSATRNTKTKQMSEAKIRTLSSGEDILDAVEKASDPQLVESCLSDFQLEILREHRITKLESAQQMVKAEIERRLERSSSNPSAFVSLLRLRLVDLMPIRGGKLATATLTWWRPSEEIQNELQEGHRFRLFNVAAGSVGESEIRLTATKCTRVEILQGQVASDDAKARRRVTPMHEMVEDSTFAPLFGEVDAVGVLVKVEDEKAPRQQPFQTIYLCDTMLNFVAVHFWGSIREYGYGTLIQQSKFVSENNSNAILHFRNLQWKKPRSNSSSLPSLFVSEHTQITANPKNDSTLAIFKEFKSEIGKGVEFKKFIAKARSSLGKLIKPSNNNASRSPITTPSAFKPQGWSHYQTPPAIPIRDPPLATSSVQIVPNSPVAVQSKDTRRRISSLSMYSDPPNLPRTVLFGHSPVVAQLSPAITKPFRVPLRTPTGDK